MIIELKKRRYFPSLGMCKTAAYDVKCDVLGLRPAQFSVPHQVLAINIIMSYIFDNPSNCPIGKVLVSPTFRITWQSFL